MPEKDDDKTKAPSLLEDEVDSLSRLSAALTRLKNKFEGQAGGLQEDYSHLNGALQAVEREAGLLNDTMDNSFESLRQVQDETLTGLDQLGRDMKTTVDAKIAENLKVLQEAQAGFQEAIRQEEAKIDEGFSSTETAFTEMSEATGQWKSSLETDQAAYEESMRQIDQRVAESGEEIVHWSENFAQMISTAGTELIERHLAEAQRGLTDLDRQTHEKLWGQLQSGFERLQSQSSGHLDAFGKEVVDASDHLGESAKNIFGNLIRHAETDVKDALEGSFTDAAKYGVEVLVEEVAVQVAESAAGQTITATLPELAVVIKAALVQLEMRKAQRGVKKVISDGVEAFGDGVEAVGDFLGL